MTDANNNIAMADAAAAADVAIPTAATPKPRRKAVVTGRKDYTGRQRLIIGTISVVTLFVVWEAVTRIFAIPTLFLPKISEIGSALVASYESGALLDNVAISANLFIWSILLALLIAIPLGVTVGAFETLNRSLTTWLWAVYTAPNVVFIPLILLWFGFTTTAKVVMIVSAAVPPSAVVIIEGVKTVEGSLLRVARSYGATRRQSLQKVIFPATLPYIGTGVRMAVSRGLVGLLGAELFTAHNGLGFLLLDAGKRYNTPLVFGILGIYLVFCMAAISASTSLEKRLSRWRE